MSALLCITIRFLQPFYHGRMDGDEPEWPPSPWRLLQALVAAAAGRWNERGDLKHAVRALHWLESQPAPTIVAPEAAAADQPYRLYVPDNVTDKVAASWSRGGDASIADHRAEKDVRPTRLWDEAVHYLYPMQDANDRLGEHISTLKLAARSVTHLGWGIDMAVGDASVVSATHATELTGRRWFPANDGGVSLRTPINGTLDELTRRHKMFLNRLSKNVFHPVPPPRVFLAQQYRRDDESPSRPFRVFELRTNNGGWFRYSHRRFIHIAGMVRHLAIDAMKDAPPAGVDDNWVDTYVAGHAKGDGAAHRQLSYLPLPSVGHPHADPGVRRVMIVAPLGDDEWLDLVERRLAWRRLKPHRGDEFGDAKPPMLVPTKGDGVSRRYTAASRVWRSFTPVILPGHDDHDPQKTRALIERALVQSGVEQPCTFEWGATSSFPKSFSAHKYDKDKKPNGYFRPPYLSTQTAAHLTLWFDGDLRVSGPLVIGAGRHCGFGLMVGDG